MPVRDGSGPQGMGPMTGRRMGNCTLDRDFAVDNNRGRGFGRGFGCGYGMGRGRRGGGFRYNSRRGAGFGGFENAQAFNDKSQLTNIINYLTDRLGSYKKRLDELDNDK